MQKKSLVDRRSPVGAPLDGDAAPGLWAWARAWPRRQFETVNVLCVGSSTTFGLGASTQEYGMVARLGYMLRGVDYSVGGMKAMAGGTHYRTVGAGWTTTGTMVDLVSDLGLNTKDMSAGASISRSCVSDGFETHFMRGSNFGGHSMWVDTSEVAVTNSSTGTNRIDGSGSTYPTLTPARGVHTLKVTATGRTGLSGIYAFDGDYSAGLRTYNGGTSGATSSNFASGSWYWHNARVAGLQPSLVVLMIGANDYATNVDPSVYEANVRTAIRYHKLVCNQPVSILLVHTFRRLDIASPTYAWPLYGDALRRIALDTTDVDFLDISAHFPTSILADWEQLISSDGVHPSNRGHALIASLIADHLRRAATYRSAPPSPSPSVGTDPSTWSNLVSAWQASTLAGQADLSAVTSWAAYAGSDQKPLAHANANRQPVLRKNQPSFANQPYVSFASSDSSIDDSLTCTFTSRYNPPVTVIVVARPLAHYGSLFSGFQAGGGVFVTLAFNVELQFLMAAGSTSAPYALGTVTGRSKWNVFVARFATGTSALFVGGLPKQDLSSLDVSHANAGLPGLTLGANSSGEGNFNKQDVAELMVFNRALSDTECTDAIAYLSRKYGFDGAGRSSVTT